MNEDDLRLDFSRWAKQNAALARGEVLDLYVDAQQDGSTLALRRVTFHPLQEGHVWPSTACWCQPAVSATQIAHREYHA